ncbi:hypothetical protein [Clostridium sp. HBUAS56017]|uniref:hypothetical protein n=1 Tax=Clostridium sp. HBUAS56017 TaxID=2571128 RepID=UPI00163DB54C|nr:hypothetical protein [Clostridium sp. HBUAS56017]
MMILIAIFFAILSVVAGREFRISNNPKGVLINGGLTIFSLISFITIVNKILGGI